MQPGADSLHRAACIGRASGLPRGFTLVEMLVVLIIIALLAALALPHIRGGTEGVAIKAASRQLSQDLAYARQKAISQRSTVAVVFLSGEVLNLSPAAPGLNADEQTAVRRLQAGLYTHYAVYSFRRVGEQPGLYTSGYLTEWKSLPEKTFFSTNQFDSGFKDINGNLMTSAFPFPFSRSTVNLTLPYVAFDPEGRCVRITSTTSGFGVQASDLELEIARGAVFFARDAQGAVDLASLQIQEIPPFNATNNLVFVDALTGRAEPRLPEVQ